MNEALDGLLLLKGAVLGVVEGVTEFLPVSSTGHLILVGDWLHFDGERAKTFEVVIQLGAILSIVWLNRVMLLRLLTGAARDLRQRGLLVNLFIAFLPAATVGFVTHKYIKAHLFSPSVVAGAFVVGGVLILLIERWTPKVTASDLYQITPKSALGVGLAQVLALIPGTSRSAATILGGYCLGLTRRTATEFSFFLAIPVMVAASGLELFKGRAFLHASDVPLFAVGFIVAFLSALVVVKAFLRYVAGHNFTAFAWYRIVFGLLMFAWYYGPLR